MAHSLGNPPLEEFMLEQSVFVVFVEQAEHAGKSVSHVMIMPVDGRVVSLPDL